MTDTLDHLRTLALQRNPDHAQRLIAYLSHQDAEIRSWALRGLSWLRAIDYAPHIASRLSDASPIVRRWAASSLALSDCPSTIRLILNKHIRTDPDESVRATSLRTLAWLGDTTVKSAIIIVLTDGEDDAVLSAALEAIGRLRLNEQSPLVVTYLKHPSPAVRQHAVRAFIRCTEAPIPESALELLKDPDPETRALMARLISVRHITDAADLVRPLLVDENPGVRATAVIAMRSLDTQKAWAYLDDCNSETHPEVLRHLMKVP